MQDNKNETVVKNGVVPAAEVSKAGETVMAPTGLVATPSETTTDETKTDETKTDETKTDETKTDETKTDETANTTFVAPVDPEVEAYGIYNDRGQLVKLFRKGPHGDNFAELAIKYAERQAGFTAKPYTPPVNLEEVDVDTVHIVTSNDQHVRTFSLKLHGKEYKKLAAQFIEKYGNKKGYKVKK